MKEQEKPKEMVNVDGQNEQQLIREFSNPDNKQPVPQPKDFDEIEY
ncbi:hypothetical protein KHA94_17360 [Bacillus sp. FJAT-49705]|uniref:Spore cortex-lytic enzyme n=1 Tax=Cytobacillus citreus TaxID=2833586 RepID=A0ABS5NWX4_9BACI|nr:hypothetical protein [Cytobacillus citreus]MBS4191939.1 hypothetical protein [Cytobacillus citreus]